ncbi:MAG: hypothetical protein ACYDBJ_05905 [Aggregatilineales bacterium]
MASWNKKKLTLQSGHRWQAKPGCKIFVADKGAVRFDIPQAWVVVPEPDSVKIYDKQPPHDDCVLAVSYFRLPPIDWSDLLLTKLLNDATKSAEREYTKAAPIVELHRADLEIAWREMYFIDDKEQREAISRICIGRRKLIQCLITFDFWVSDAERCKSAWETVLETLTLSQFVSDPTTGR